MKKILYPELVGEMAKHGNSQKELAKELGITDVSISRKLSGKADWKLSEIDKICELYNKNYHELFRKERGD